jgi:hypothetical protein
MPGVNEYVRMLSSQQRGQQNGIAVVSPALPDITIEMLCQLHRFVINHTLNLVDIIG